MKKIFKLGFLNIILVALMVSCDNSQSLQQYYVDSKENNEFISLDIPSSILQLKSDDIEEEVKKTLETIKKVNFLALQLTDSNSAMVAEEQQKVKKILQGSKYKELMKMNANNINVSVNYLGEEEAIDEVIIFGSENTKGFAIVRVIGENMNPSDIFKLMEKIQLDGNSGEMKQLESILKGVI
jgi:hypothetical protein